MRRSAFLLIFFVCGAAGVCRSQAVPTGYGRSLTVSAGGMVSGFDPHDANQKNYYSNGSKLLGVGTFVDVHFNHWVQVEAEGRWLRWHGEGGEHMDNYLIGLRVPVKEFHRTQIYGKTLIGMGKMTFPFGYGYGTFTDLAFGGTVEYDISRKVKLRAADFEYQYWPVWLNHSSLSPYGVSVGVAYRVF